MTYRAAPLQEGRLVGEMEHSVLGIRYEYDATTDPVYLDTLRQIIHEGGHEAPSVMPDGLVLPQFRTAAAVTGVATNPSAAGGSVDVLRRPLEADRTNDPDVVGKLTGTRQGQHVPAVLALLLRT